MRCDVFDLRRINSMQLALGSVFVGWHYANPSETEVLITYRQPQPKPTITFNTHDLLDDILGLFIRGRVSRQEADNMVMAVEKGGAA